MKNSADRILTTHAGSLVRTPQLIAAMRAKEHGVGVYDEAAFAANVSASVADVVRRQVEAGIDIPSDGEQSKSSFSNYTHDRLEGLVAESLPPNTPARTGKDRTEFAEFYRQYDPLARNIWMPQEVTAAGAVTPPPERWACTGPVAYKGRDLLQKDIDNFKHALQGVHAGEAFLPAAAPTMVTYNAVNRYYKDDEAFAFALADAMHVEYQAIVDAGFILQIDAPEMPAMYDRMLGTGSTTEEYLRYATMCVEATNQALRGIPEDRVRYHICWGSWNGPHTTDIPLRDIVDILLRVNSQAYSVEAANPRHEYEWEVWKDVKLPEGKILIPGVIAHTTNVVEHPETVAMRLKNYASIVGRQNVIGGTDCGFSQGWSSMRVHPQVQWAKLQALAEGARLATRALWNR